MTTTKKILIVAFALEALLVGSYVKHALKYEKIAKIALGTPIGRMGPTIRLHQLKDGYFTCSGTVVSSTRIVTAAHCLGGSVLAGPAAGFEVRGADSAPIGVFAKVAGADFRSDQAVLSGDFRLFDTRHLQTSPAEIIRRMATPGRKFIVCGYPYAGPLFCSPIVDIQQWSFQFAGRGYMYPGMSGGPMIDLETNEIIAVNTGVMISTEGDTKLLVSPTIDTYQDTNSTEY